VTKDEQILFCAFRYCLGRMTYVVSDCCDWLRERWPACGSEFRSLVKKEIDEAIVREDEHIASLGRHIGCTALGMEMDSKSWRELRAWMETN
jgi:hypothetical protein